MTTDQYNLSINQGSTFTKQFQLFDANGTPLDLTGYSFASQLRLAYSDPTASAAFTCAINSPPTSGTFTMGLHASSSMALTSKCYLYDVEMTVGTTVTRILQGKAVVSPEVTK